MGSADHYKGIQNSSYLAFNKIDIDREDKANNYEIIRVEVAKLHFEACFCMILTLGMAFVFAV